MSSNHDKWIFAFNTLYPPMDARKHTHILCDHLAVSPINFNYKLFENCDLVCFSFRLSVFVSLLYGRRGTSLAQLSEQDTECATSSYLLPTSLWCEWRSICWACIIKRQFFVQWTCVWIDGRRREKKWKRNEKSSAKCAYACDVLPLRCLPFSTLYQNAPLCSHLSLFPPSLSHPPPCALFVFYLAKTKMGPIENEHISTETFGI